MKNRNSKLIRLMLIGVCLFSLAGCQQGKGKVLSRNFASVAVSENGVSEVGLVDNQTESTSNSQDTAMRSDAFTGESTFSISQVSSTASDDIKRENTTETTRKPRLIQPKYATSDVVVADIVVGSPPFDADTSGIKDSTQVIQEALNACADSGGGTVWLPAGKYRVTKGIRIPAFVTLRGDWQDPDLGNEYGTIILADVPSQDKEKPALFTIGGSSCAMGLTVYYPNQDINNVKPYPFTFYVVGTGTDYMLQSVVNCTIINGYRGVGACVSETNAHEMMTIDTVKGTFLKVGFEAYNQADVGTWKNVTISSSYWANAGAGLKSASQSKIDTYCKANTTGLKLGDLEWTEFSNLSISGCNTGINIVKGKRIEFAGSLFDFKITDCLHGLIVDSIDERWGMVAAQGEISATVAIKNNTNGVVKMAGCQINGQNTGNHIVNDSFMDKITVSYSREPSKPASYLYVVSADITGLTDTSAAIQAQLNKAKKTGGIVYLPAGKYLLQKSLTVPAGVELRGCSSAAQREQNYASEGTLILADYGQTVSPDTAQALVTLQGVNSGVRGVRFFYINNNFRLGVKKYSYTIRGRASGVYAVNVSIAAGYNGIDFRNCDNHHIDKLIGCCYQNMIAAGGKNGMIEGCLQNGTILYRNGLDLIGWSKSEQMIQNELFNPITRPNTEYIRLENATGETILNTFAYGVRNLIVSQNSTGVKIVNVGADNLYNTTPLLEVLNGEVFGVNIMRYNGKSYQNTNGKIKLYNRLTINNQSEQTVIE